MNFFDKVPITNIPEQLLAEQLTLYDWKLFSLIDFEQLKGYKPASKENATICPDIQVLLKWSVKFFCWVCLDVLQLDFQVRTSRLKYWIEMCDELMKLNNLHAIAAITSALSAPYVARLHRTWSSLPSESISKFNHFKGLFSDESDFKNYRNYLQQQKRKPFIPSFAVHWKDLNARLKGQGSITMEDVSIIFATSKKNIYTSINAVPEIAHKFDVTWENCQNYKEIFNFWSKMVEFPHDNEKYMKEKIPMKNFLSRIFSSIQNSKFRKRKVQVAPAPNKSSIQQPIQSVQPVQPAQPIQPKQLVAQS